jgi:hypothetical protein
MIKYLIAILLIIWIVGLVLDVVGALIHIVLVLVVIAAVWQFFVSRRSTA